MRLGDPVIWHGRIYRLRGFDPMSVEACSAYLEDGETRETVRVPAGEIEPAPPADEAG
ncbi:MAG TPA: hypothetical protein VFI37_00585 [Gaiellaceae bacterium]|jgi:hypothetical protein|nr:hypothetical protein [Gaiellaceae bacterium]